MSRRSILCWPDPALRRVAAPVEEITAEIRDLAADLLDTMYAAPGRGLAATQIGAMHRVFVMDAEWKTGPANPVIMLNPEIVWSAPERALCDEGCLSLPGIVVTVERPAEVRLRWQTLCGGLREESYRGLAAACVQHERDHLDGQLCIDLIGEEARAMIAPALRLLETSA